MSYSTWLCSKRIIFFSTSQMFHFWNKVYEKKKGKMLFLSLCVLPSLTPAEQLQPFERGRIKGLPKAGWTYRQIATHVGHSVSVVCRCFQQWCAEHSHTRKPGFRRPHCTDARQDRCIVASSVAAWTELILQPFRYFTYVTVHSPTLLSLLLHKLFT